MRDPTRTAGNGAIMATPMENARMDCLRMALASPETGERYAKAVLTPIRTATDSPHGGCAMQGPPCIMLGAGVNLGRGSEGH